jgi:hypothetical protein
MEMFGVIDLEIEREWTAEVRSPLESRRSPATPRAPVTCAKGWIVRKPNHGMTTQRAQECTH